MEQIRIGLEQGLNVNSFLYPTLTASEMKFHRNNLLINKQIEIKE